MLTARKMDEFAARGSWIRRMFEEGARLKAQYGAEQVADFSLGNPDLSPPPGFSEVLLRVAAETGPGRHGYMANSGYLQARQAVAARVGVEQGASLAAGDVLMTCGAAGGLNVVFKALLDPGDEVIVLAPYFVEYGFYIDNHGGLTKVVPTTTDFGLDLEEIGRALTPKTKAILINSPNNPSGRIYSKEELDALADLLRREGRRRGRDICLVADEPYRKIVYDGREVPGIFSLYEESVVVSSHSKDLSVPGERIGYVAVHPAMKNKEQVLGAMTLANRILGFVNAPALMQRVLAQMPDAVVDISVYAGRRALFCRILSEAGYRFRPPDGAFYLFPRSPLEDDAAFVALLLEEKILAVPGRGFGMPGYFRLAFCVEDKVIERAAAGFVRAMQAAGGGR